jgi:hypothetical protein
MNDGCVVGGGVMVCNVKTSEWTPAVLLVGVGEVAAVARQTAPAILPVGFGGVAAVTSKWTAPSIVFIPRRFI